MTMLPGTDEDDLLHRLAAWAARTASVPRAAVAAPATVELAEELLGLPLSPLLARVYREVGDGGFGPGHGLLPLFRQGFGAADGYPSRVRSRSGGRPWWPRGVLPVLHWGAGAYAAVDCASPDGLVLFHSPGEGGLPDMWFVESEGLAGWLETWLDGTEWHRPRAAGTGALDGPILWDAAASRLDATDD